jgi:hypothetical protein
MGLLSKKAKAPKAPKVICPSCGKPQSAVSDATVPRCVLCNGVLPTQAMVMPAKGPAEPPPARTSTEPETFDAEALQMTTFAKVPQGRGGLQQMEADESFDAGGLQMTQFDKAPQGRGGLAQAQEFESFDMNALQIGDPAPPRPSSNE